MADFSLIQNTQDAFNGQNKTQCAKFQGSPLFQATYNIRTEKETID